MVELSCLNSTTDIYTRMETKTRAWLIDKVLVWVVSGTQLTFTVCELVLYVVGRRNEWVKQWPYDKIHLFEWKI